jgi:hypothetical protein
MSTPLQKFYNYEMEFNTFELKTFEGASIIEQTTYFIDLLTKNPQIKIILEIGFNAVRSYDIEFFNDNWNINWLANPVLGYRLITPKGVIFRVTLTPFFNNINQGYGVNFIPYGGLSLGKMF